MFPALCAQPGRAGQGERRRHAVQQHARVPGVGGGGLHRRGVHGMIPAAGAAAGLIRDDVLGIQSRADRDLGLIRTYGDKFLIFIGRFGQNVNISVMQPIHHVAALALQLGGQGNGGFQQHAGIKDSLFPLHYAVCRNGLLHRQLQPQAHQVAPGQLLLDLLRNAAAGGVLDRQAHAHALAIIYKRFVLIRFQNLVQTVNFCLNLCDFGILRHGVDCGAQLGDRPGLGVSRVVGAGAGLHARSVLGGRGGHLPSAPVVAQSRAVRDMARGAGLRRSAGRGLPGVGRQRAVCLAAHLANGLCRAGSRAAGVGGLVGPGMAAGVLLPVVRAVRMPLFADVPGVVSGNGQDRCVLIDVVNIAVLERSPTAGALVMFPLACGVAGGGGLRYKHPRVDGMCRRGYHVAALGAELRRSLGGLISVRCVGVHGGLISAGRALVPVTASVRFPRGEVGVGH